MALVSEHLYCYYLHTSNTFLQKLFPRTLPILHIQYYGIYLSIVVLPLYGYYQQSKTLPKMYFCKSTRNLIFLHFKLHAVYAVRDKQSCRSICQIIEGCVLWAYLLSYFEIQETTFCLKAWNKYYANIYLVCTYSHHNQFLQFKFAILYLNDVKEAFFAWIVCKCYTQRLYQSKHLFPFFAGCFSAKCWW